MLASSAFVVVHYALYNKQFTIFVDTSYQNPFVKEIVETCALRCTEVSPFGCEADLRPADADGLRDASWLLPGYLARMHSECRRALGASLLKAELYKIPCP